MAYSQKLLLFTVSGLFFLLAGSMAGAEGDGQARQDRHRYLKHGGETFAHYLELRADGSYRRVAKGSQSIEERDHGKWRQNGERKLLLLSDAHLRNISSGDLLISMRQRDRLKTLPDLRQRIQAFLKAYRSQEFPAEEIERIRETSVGGDPHVKVPDITVLGPKRVHRSDLEKLLVEIDRFLSSSEKNLFTLVPLEYKTATIYVDDDRAELTKKIIADELAGAPTPTSTADRHGYQEIDAAQFLKETNASQAASLSSSSSQEAEGHGHTGHD
ncbi:MAG: hypothetical protein NNA20_04225 [Nitrospira sp.]|nr:hypothetical protein [Nitrospira sp.]MCP9441779.1 hypothetical protein [Nitrospira sp.]